MILTDNTEIRIFFDKKNYNIIGWQTEDIYQNLIITYIQIKEINMNLKNKLFNLPN